VLSTAAAELLPSSPSIRMTRVLPPGMCFACADGADAAAGTAVARFIVPLPGCCSGTRGIAVIPDLSMLVLAQEPRLCRLCLQQQDIQLYDPSCTAITGSRWQHSGHTWDRGSKQQQVAGFDRCSECLVVWSVPAAAFK